MTNDAFSDQLPSSRPFMLVWFAYFIILLVGVWFLLLPAGMAERMDFRQLYAGGYLARTAPTDLYDYDRQKSIQDDFVSHADGLLPFIRPAYETFLFIPFSRLPYRTAYLLFLCLNVSLLIPCFFLCRDVFSQPGTMAQPKAGVQLFAFFPVMISILQGQDSILLLLGLCVVFRCLKSQKYFLAGASLALMLFKLQIVLPLALFFVFRFGFLFLSGFAAFSILVSAASVTLVGWQSFLSFGRALLLTASVSISPGIPRGSLGVNPLAMPNLKGLLTATTTFVLPGRILFALTILISICVVLWTIRVLAASRLEVNLAFSLAVASAILVSYYLHIQDLTVMQIPLGLMARSKNSYVSKASFLIYLAPPVLVMIGHDALFLLSLPIMVFMYGTYEMSRRAAMRMHDLVIGPVGI